MAVRLFAAAGLVVLDARLRLVGLARRVHRASRPSPCFIVLPLLGDSLCDGGCRRRRWSPWSCSPTASDQYWQQMGTITSDADYNHTSETGRLQIWSRGIGYMMDEPGARCRAGQFPTAEGTLSPLAERQQCGIGVRWNAPHNSFVADRRRDSACRASRCYVAVIASAFRGAAARRSTPRRRRVALAPDAGADRLAASASSSARSSSSLAYSEMLYTLVALAVGLRKVSP